VALKRRQLNRLPRVDRLLPFVPINEYSEVFTAPKLLVKTANRSSGKLRMAMVISALWRNRISPSLAETAITSMGSSRKRY
jgi:hypothetical protein